MLDLPAYIPLLFGTTVVITLAIFHYTLVPAMGQRAWLVTAGLVLWAAGQSLLALTGFYLKDLDQLPPRFALVLVPALLVILMVFGRKRGRALVDRLPLAPLTYVSAVRILVELVLYELMLSQAVPELMTFAGRNFDILAGITAPLVAYFGLQRNKLNRRLLIGWHICALGLLLFIVINAILSTPTPVQQFAFDQPNVAIFYFPFVLLPALVVPIILFAHLASLRRLFALPR